MRRFVGPWNCVKKDGNVEVTNCSMAEVDGRISWGKKHVRIRQTQWVVGCGKLK